MLRAVGLTKYFGAFAAGDHIDLVVQESTLHSVVGPNGAGKTTLFNLISGLFKSLRKAKLNLTEKILLMCLLIKGSIWVLAGPFRSSPYSPNWTSLKTLGWPSRRKERGDSTFSKTSDLKEIVGQSYEILCTLGLGDKAFRMWMSYIIGIITPPFGYNLFFMQGLGHTDASMEDIYRSVLPYIPIMVFALALCVVFPQLAKVK